MSYERGSAELLLPGANPVQFPITGIGKGVLGSDSLLFERSKIKVEGGALHIPEAPPAPVPTSLFNPTSAGTDTTFQPGAPKPAFNPGSLKVPYSLGQVIFNTTLPVRNNNDHVSVSDNKPAPDSTQRVAGAVVGTSFSNVRWLLEHHDELERIKSSNH
jgi:hypothetical protein